MPLTKHQVQHLAKLARLNLNEQEVEKFTAQLDSVLRHLDTLKTVDTEGVEETSQVSGLYSVMRPDTALPSLSQDDVLKTSQNPHQRGMIQVRKSI